MVRPWPDLRTRFRPRRTWATILHRLPRRRERSELHRTPQTPLNESVTDPRLSAAIHLDDAFDRGATDFAEVVRAREHYAIDFRPVIPACLIHRAFKRPNLPEVLLRRKHLLLVCQLFFKERFHLFFRSLVFSKLDAALLNLSRVV